MDQLRKSYKAKVPSVSHNILEDGNRNPNMKQSYEKN